MSEPITNPSNNPTTEPETAPEKTFTQAEVDSMIGRRLAAATKGMPGKEELEAFRAWKESQQTEKDRWENLTKERDENKTALTAAQEELEQYKREKFLLGKGISTDDVDYYAFKIGKLVDDKTDFETAAENFMKEHTTAKNSVQEKPGTFRMSSGAPVGGGTTQLQSLNDRINNKLRGA